MKVGRGDTETRRRGERNEKDQEKPFLPRMDTDYHG